MKILYLECHMGAAGDMLTAALYELLTPVQREAFLDTMNHLLPGVTVRACPAVTCGITGTRMEVTVHGEAEESRDVAPEKVGGSHLEGAHPHSHHHDHGAGHAHDDHDPHHHHHHPHTAPGEIAALLDTLAVPETVRRRAKAVYQRIAEAEAAAHGMPVEEIHFHEVGALDAVADVTGVCLALELLAPDRIEASPIHVGSGQVQCAHGIVPVPAPATAHLLRGVPCYGGSLSGELCTPTGAALLAEVAQSFGAMPLLQIHQTGYGIGHKEFPAANCVRVFWGEGSDGPEEEISELVCHLDDMTPEALGFALERFLEQGALDAAAAPLLMKKGRPGAALTVLCPVEREEEFAESILRETSTNGVRVRRCPRYTLTTERRQVETPYGPVGMKRARGRGICREKPEYEEVAAAARTSGVPFRTVWEAACRQAAEEAEALPISPEHPEHPACH